LSLIQARLEVARAEDIVPPEGFTKDEWDRRRATANFIDWGDPIEPAIITRRMVSRVVTGCEMYRHFDGDGALLYVGISGSTIFRTTQHEKQAAWYDDVATITIERFPSREEAAAAEKAAIKSERPIHNKKHAVAICAPRN
jgi:hypothetical protein